MTTQGVKWNLIHEHKCSFFYIFSLKNRDDTDNTDTNTIVLKYSWYYFKKSDFDKAFILKYQIVVSLSSVSDWFFKLKNLAKTAVLKIAFSKSKFAQVKFVVRIIPTQFLHDYVCVYPVCVVQ